MLGYIRRFLSFLLSFFKRIFKKSHKDTPILPSAFNSANKQDDGWDSWEPMTSIVVDKKDEGETPPPPQIDFFADMVPEFKQPAQIRIRTSNDSNGTQPPSSRFAVDTAFNVTAASALGDLDDSDVGWGEEEALDDTEIITVKNEAMKQKRAQEREKRRKEKEKSSKLSWLEVE